ncbi:MAG: N-6 DNA methylase, partial [Candidatus Heimdallarchaeota archaeon]|nr:N-6 DNA methylase [Candidatus Heimdallarchaeota archaeon]MCK4611609.1 N-6 DNA methylase [Candidatus Heimdallarchaeota archaeon]
CDKLKISDTVLGIIIEQLNLVSFRKFTSDILGNTYEAYLGEQLTIVNNKIRLTSSKLIQKKQGIYYTPTVVVKYIIEKTLRPKLDEIWGESLKLLHERKIKEFIDSFSRINEVKVLDPAMGSGSFIISAFDIFAEYYEKCNSSVKAILSEWKDIQLTDSLILQELTSNYENRILTENIYGVDIDKQAAEIASLNLFLRGLKKNVQLPLILEDNIKVGNSLISPTFEGTERINFKKEISELVNIRLSIKKQMSIRASKNSKVSIRELMDKYYSIKNEILQKLIISLSKKESERYFSEPSNRQIFVWEIEFPEVFFDEKGNYKTDAGFDCVIGNPPYIDIYKLSKNDPEGVEFFKDTYNCAKMKFDIYILFMEKGYNLLKTHGCMSYIIPYPFIYQNYAESMRNLLLNSSVIEELADLSSIKVFPSANVKSLIFCIKKIEKGEGFEESDVVITTIPTKTLNDLLTEERNTKIIPQRFFHQMPNSMFRVNTTTEDIRLWEIIENNSVPLNSICYVNWGLRTGDAKRTKEMIVNEKTHSKAKPMLRGENIEKPFFYSYSNQYIIYDKEKLHNPLSEEVFQNPKVLIKKISGKKGVVSVVDSENYFCYNTIIVCLPYP